MIKWQAALLLLTLALLLLAALSLLCGAAGIGWPQVVHGLDPSQQMILLQLRLPRILMALLAGAGLGVSGALMQAFFRNALAEPYITGVSAGGALGAVAGGALGFASTLGLGLSAILGGSLITLTLFAFGLRRRSHAPLSVLLLGISLGTLCGALVWLLMLRQDAGQMSQNMAWLLGRVATVGYQEVLFLLPVTVLGVLIALFYAKDLDALLLGDEKAASLGVNLLAARRGILAAASLLACACVAFCGVIAFVGLIVPHIVRSLVGPRHIVLLPVSALGGAVLLLGVDLIARTINPPAEVPLTIITSLIGAPFFIAVLLRTREVAL